MADSSHTLPASHRAHSEWITLHVVFLVVAGWEKLTPLFYTQNYEKRLSNLVILVTDLGIAPLSCMVNTGTFWYNSDNKPKLVM